MPVYCLWTMVYRPSSKKNPSRRFGTGECSSMRKKSLGSLGGKPGTIVNGPI